MTASWPALFAAMLLAGCAGSIDVNYLTLSADVSPGASTPVSDSTRRISLVNTQVPGVIDRLQLVQAKSANTVILREHDQWAEPIDQMVRRVLRDDLAGRPVVRARRVSVDLTEFMAHTDGTSRVAGSWRELDEAGQPLPGSDRRFGFEEPTDPADSASVAASLSRLLGAIADRIARSR